MSVPLKNSKGMGRLAVDQEKRKVDKASKELEENQQRVAT